ncbi:MAG: glycosyltransferase family 4 protein [Lachnospiraceae bacterium]|jgi:glycosyltransferase involved in cell wall biosynthesis|nr:glycosyltransferase family 4 protein [Lachnospiraceae bacterium]
MKKILMVCEAFGGGVFTYVSQLCNDMIDTFDIYLAYSVRPQTPQNYKDFLDPRIHLVEVKHFGKKSLTNIYNDFKIIKELREIKRTVNPDIIHLHSSIAGGIGRLAFSGKRNTIIYTPHGYAHILMGGGKKSSLYKIMEKVLGKKKAITLTCCESENDVAKTMCKTTAYIETGVNLYELSNSLKGITTIKNEKFTVFTLGRICLQKQPSLFNKIAELVPEANFIWIGNGELECELTAPNIKITGWKPRNEALAIAKGADAFILCSFGEAIAMSLIENMYMKKLVLVSNTMGNKSVIHNGINGYVCNKAEDYAKQIKNAMVHFPNELPVRAYNDVIETYNTNIMKQKYIKFYSSL